MSVLNCIKNIDTTKSYFLTVEAERQNILTRAYNALLF